MEYKADILIITVTPVESEAVIQVFTTFSGKELALPSRIDGRNYFDLGKINGQQIFMGLSEMGSDGLGGSLMTVGKGIDALSPSAVIMTGIAFGINKSKQSIGNVLISQQLMLYELQRVGTNKEGNVEIILRGDRPHASDTLINSCKSAMVLWDKTNAKVRLGPILSGNKLVDNIDFRGQLLKFESEAIGGEMEGAGLYVACQDRNVDWILVKAICDWADGKKDQDKDQRQKLAAYNAASFVLHMLTTCYGENQKGESDRQTQNSQPIGTKTTKTITDEYRNNLLLQIHDPFIYQLEKELLRDMKKYFHSDITTSDNYLTILYFSHEMQEVIKLYNEISDLYSREQPKNLSDGLIVDIKDKLNAVEEHTRLTADLINVVIGKTTYYPLRETIEETLNNILIHVKNAKMGLLQNNIPELWRRFSTLQQEINVYKRCLTEINKYLQDSLKQNK